MNNNENRCSQWKLFHIRWLPCWLAQNWINQFFLKRRHTLKNNELFSNLQRKLSWKNSQFSCALIWIKNIHPATLLKTWESNKFSLLTSSSTVTFASSFLLKLNPRIFNWWSKAFTSDSVNRIRSFKLQYSTRAEVWARGTVVRISLRSFKALNSIFFEGPSDAEQYDNIFLKNDKLRKNKLLTGT